MPAPSDPTSTRWHLTWSPTLPPSTPLPSPIVRTFIPTPSGPLELLSTQPSSPPSSTASSSPILFCHGGFGCAEVFVPWLTHLASRGYNAHALSLRGHGHSWAPGFFRMTVLTSAYTLATDVAAGVAYLEEKFGAKGGVVLAGHSSGGGLVQMVCDRELAQVKALILVAGTPSFGASCVYRAWWRMDPWFLPRLYLRDWWHPRSPLSSSELVKGAFFCPSFPLAQVRPFEKLLSETESYVWPVNIMFRGFIDTRRVLMGCKRRVFVLAGELDRLMRVEFMERMAAEYRGALRGMERDGGDVRGKVGFEVVRGSGHHVMNDLRWEEGVEIVEGWLEELGEDE